jgi:catechol 2,3-dioxygenase
MSIDPGAAIGGVHLRVSDLDRSLAFYTRVLGLEAFSTDARGAVLGVGEEPLLWLRALAGAVPRPGHTTGLYHFALLVPDRHSLGLALARLVAARWPLQGASDHGVSEAIYLVDPDGLGIEIYRDRPRSEWPRTAAGPAMVSDALDLRELLDASVQDVMAPATLPAGTRMGHIHLQVKDIAEAERFYVEALGFDVAQRMGASALFVSAGGYHHHVGLNSWGVAGAPAQPDTAPGLDYVEVVLPGPAALEAARRRLTDREVALVQRDAGWLAVDPSSNAVLITAA